MRGPLLLFVLGLLVQQPGEHYPGQSSHAHPPAGWECRDKPLPGEHECHCKRMRMDKDADPLCENEPQEDSECEVYCWAKRHFDADPKGPIDPLSGQRGRWHAAHCRCPIPPCEIPRPTKE